MPFLKEYQLHAYVEMLFADNLVPYLRDFQAQAEMRYQRLVEACDFETLVSRQYTPSCMQRRDRYMVDHAALLIAAFDGSPGGTRYTMEYAMRQGLEITDLPV